MNIITLEYIKKTREYLDYLETHIRNVEKAYNLICDKCSDMDWMKEIMSGVYIDLYFDVRNHDLSKLSEEEFVQYRKHFYPTKYELKNDDIGDAWKHHMECNHHHHQTAETKADIIHMIIDLTAMGFVFGDTAQEYYENNKDSISLSEEHKTFMYEIFDRLK